MSAPAYFKKGSTARALLFQFQPALDLSQASNLKFNSVDRWGRPAIVDGAAALAVGSFDVPGLGLVTYTAADAVVMYQWGASDLDVPGFYRGWFSATLGGKPYLGPDYGFAEYAVEALR